MRVALPRLQGAAVATGIAAGVLLATLSFISIAADRPIVALAVPAILIATIVAGRWPAFAILVMLVAAGGVGSLQAFFGIPAGLVVDVALAALWASVLFSYVIKSRTRPWWVWPGMALTLLYIVLTFFEMWTARGVGLGLLSFKYSTWYLMGVPLLAFAGWKLGTYVRIANALVLVALGVAAYAVLRLFIGVSGQEASYAFQHGAGAFNVVDGELSLIGSFPNRHALAFFAACTVPFCLAIALTPGKRIWRLAAALAVPLAIAATFGTDVRIALPALVAGGAIVILLNLLAGRGRGGPLAQALVALMLAITGGAALFTLVVDNTDHYESALDPQSDNSFNAHLIRWEAVLNELDEQPLGFGLATAGRMATENSTRFVTLGSFSIDSTYLKVAYEQGFLVLALFVGALIGLFVGLARRAVRTRAGPTRGIAIGAAGTMAPALVMFLTGIYVETLGILFVWLAIGAGIGALGAVREVEAERTESDLETPPQETPRPAAAREPVLGRA